MEVDVTRLTHLVRTLEAACNDKSVVADVLTKSGLRGWTPETGVDTIKYENEVLFVREACLALGDVTFGAKAGLSNTVANHLNGYIAKYSQDLRSAIVNTSRFYSLFGPDISYSLRLSGNAASIEVEWKDRSYAKYHRHMEFVLFGALARMRTLTQTNFFPHELRFDHKVSRSLQAFQKLAGFPVVFGADEPEIILSLSSLDLPIPTYDPRLSEHLTEYGQRLLSEQKSGHFPLRAQVESVLMGALPGKILTADEVAANLGLSTRTFARRLKEDGDSYRDIVDNLRSDLAKTFMNDAMSLSEIAHLLGYADQAAFSTAFKRWTGLTPGRYK